jgi:phosphatidylglycerophosphate synthase
MKGLGWRLPGPRLRAGATVALLAAALVAMIVAAAASLSTGVGATYLSKVLISFVSMAVLAVGFAERHHPFQAFGLANQITLVRLALVAVLLGLVNEPPTNVLAWFAILTITVAGVLDGLDGWLARRERLASAFGARLDMETDAALILVASVLVWQHDKAGAWVLVCGLMRYLFIAAGWVVEWLAQPLRSTCRGKAVAVVQLVGLGVALAPIVRAPLSGVVAAFTLAALCWSFAVDVLRLRRQTRL